MDTGVSDRRLHRSRRERIVFGVCGGLGEYFEVDPVLVRLIFVLISLAGGAGLLAYIVLAIVLPEEGTESPGGRGGLRQNLDSLSANASELATDLTGGTGATNGGQTARHERNQQIGALVLIGLGLLFVANNLGWFAWFHWGTFWPLILIVIGVALLLRRGRST